MSAIWKEIIMTHVFMEKLKLRTVKGNTNIAKCENKAQKKKIKHKLLFSCHWTQTSSPPILWSCLLCTKHLVKGGDGPRGQTVKAEASLDGGDGALKVRRVQQLGELEQAMAKHEELGEKWADQQIMDTTDN